MAQWQDRNIFHENHPFAKLNRVLNWSLYCGRPVAGIKLYLHWSVLILPIVTTSLLSSWMPMSFGDGVLIALLSATILYGSIYLHELGHAITALQLGYPVKNIVLYILGGVAQTYGSRTAHHEFAVVAFGPMVNFVLVGVAALFNWLLIPWLGITMFNGWWVVHPLISFEYFFYGLFWVNLTLGVFNLIPMFPLDGSWMLRAVLSLKYDPTKMTFRVAWVGQWIIAPIFFIVAIVTFRPLLALIGLWGIMACQQQKMIARYTPVYDRPSGPGWQASYAGGGGWQDSTGTGAMYGGWSAEAQDIENEQKPEKKGWLARRREEKAAKRAEKDAQREADDRKRMDDLLAKIHEEGIGALSEKEKAFLKTASKRYQ